MRKQFIFLLFLLSVSMCSLAQLGLPVKVFYSEIVPGEYTGTTIEDNVIELFSDSTIKCSNYQFRSFSYPGVISRLIYYGTYSLSGDTVRVKYISYFTESKSSSQKIKSASDFKPNNEALKYLRNVFILNDSSMEAPNDPYSQSKNSKLYITSELDYMFNHWDKAFSYMLETSGSMLLPVPTPVSSKPIGPSLPK